jgi:hypothetical protein
MTNSFTEVSSQSWVSRLFESIKSVLFGLVLFVVSFPILFWNEGRAVRTARSLTEGLGAVASVPSDAVSPGNDGKLVHVSGAVKTDAPVADDQLGIQADSVKLLRNVEMFQWVEHEKRESHSKIGGGTETVTTYTYAKEWAKGRVDSSSFKHPEDHENPQAAPFESKTFVADPVKVGAFTMSSDQIAKLNNATDLPVEASAADKLPEDLKGKLQVKDGKFYTGEDPATPKVGDARVSFQVVKPATVSLVAVQMKDSFAPYQAKAGDQILLVQDGTHTAQEMFQTAQSENATLTWILRVVGFFMMFLGMVMVFRPIVVFADVLPIFGTMLGAGIGLFAFLGAAILTIFTIAVSWVFVRPVLGITLFLVAGAALFWLVKVGQQKKVARAAASGSLPAPVSV